MLDFLWQVYKLLSNKEMYLIRARQQGSHGFERWIIIHTSRHIKYQIWLTMRVCNNGSTGFRTSSTKHETCKIKRRFFIIFPFILHQSQLFLQIFIYHKVNHSFTNSPIRGCNTFPKTSNSLKKWKKFVKTINSQFFSQLLCN